jgi:hypothetical protein
VFLLDENFKRRFALLKEKAAKYQCLILKLICINNTNQELGFYELGKSDFIMRVMSNCSESLT